jgi:uncharacterized membrane protein
MTWSEFWLFLHVVGVITWVGGGIAIQVFGVLTKRAADPAKTAFFARNVGWIVMRVFLPAAIVVLVSGIGVVETIGWDWGEPFIVFGLLLWAMVSLVAFGFLGRALGKAALRLETEGPGPVIGLHLRNLVWLSRALLGALLLIVFLMTVKPGT